MPSTKISDFFNRRFFEIPKYQRGYAWEVTNVRELFEDINEAIQSKTNHYIGTIVLSKSDEENKYQVVDGQQRITTLTLILNALVKKLGTEDAYYFDRFYIKEGDRYRLKPLNRDSDFFIKLLEGQSPEPQNKSQRYLVAAYREIKTKVDQISDKIRFLYAIEKLEIMEFVENTEGDAIRIFQTVNDRGKPLSNMEKTKSLLIYFSNRYLNKRLDDEINDSFSDIFEIYDDIKHTAEENDITLINNVNFNEDYLMRYHFVTWSNENYDPTATFVLQSLKNSLTDLRSKAAINGFEELEKFISKYVLDLKNFFTATKEVIEKTKQDPKYYKLFSILNLSARLYPLISKLQMRKIIDKPLPTDNKFLFFDLIELIDVRVYKIRGTDPKKHIADFVYQLDNLSEEQIETWLKWFNSYWMSKELFQSNLNGNMYNNAAIRAMLLEYSESIANTKYSVDILKDLISRTPTTEHILAQTPNFSPVAFGFTNMEDFLNYEHRIGNLTILEKSLNSSIQNLIPVNKVGSYDKSVFEGTRKVASEIDTIKRFTKSEVEQRTRELSDFCSKRWWC